jgi:hypothetical protein
VCFRVVYPDASITVKVFSVLLFSYVMLLLPILVNFEVSVQDPISRYQKKNMLRFTICT